MSIGWQIYFIGYLVALYKSIRVMRDEKTGLILGSDLAICVVMSLLSWIMVLALWLGANIKYSEMNRKSIEELLEDDDTDNTDDESLK